VGTSRVFTPYISLTLLSVTPEENMRPSLPPSQLANGPLMNIIRASWDRLPSNRPPFEQIVRDVKQLLRAERSSRSLSTLSDSPKPPSILLQWAEQNPYPPHHSPDILPLPLSDGVLSAGSQNSNSNTSNDLGHPGSALGLDIGTDRVKLASNVHVEGRADFSDTGNTKPGSLSSDTESSIASIPDQTVLASVYLSPLDSDTIAAKYQDERRYRMLLQHDYHTIRRPFIASLRNHLTL
jgi:abelson tyrosine-protein kinase 1